MSKRTYQAKSVQRFSIEQVLEQTADGERITVGCDAAKRSWRAAMLTERTKAVLGIIKFDLLDTREVLTWFKRLRDAGRVVEFVAESTGTYADPFAYQVELAGFPMFQVSTKHVKDASEVYDGVPSSHDSKSACVIADLFLWRRDRARAWPNDQRRRLLTRLRAPVQVLKREQQQDLGRVEALLARHWPELSRELALDSATAIRLFEEFGSPSVLAADLERGREFLQRVSRRKLSEAKIGRILAAARNSLGVPMGAEEVSDLQWYGTRLRERRGQLKAAKKALVDAVEQHHPNSKELVACLGGVTTGMLLADVGDPADFANARALLKHLGLNLKVHTSGTITKQGLHITKRGSSRCRHWLYLAALRLMKGNPIVAAWVNSRAVRQGRHEPLKQKAIIALMRKLVTALPHLARGEAFDARKLFDTRKLITDGWLSADLRTAITP